jgi:hypothetical protein
MGKAVHNELFILEDRVEIDHPTRDTTFIALRNAFDIEYGDGPKSYDLVVKEGQTENPRGEDLYTVPLYLAEFTSDAVADFMAKHTRGDADYERFLVKTPDRELPSLYNVGKDRENRRGIFPEKIVTTDLDKIREILDSEKVKRIEEVI